MANEDVSNDTSDKGSATETVEEKVPAAKKEKAAKSAKAGTDTAASATSEADTAAASDANNTAASNAEPATPGASAEPNTGAPETAQASSETPVAEGATTEETPAPLPTMDMNSEFKSDSFFDVNKLGILNDVYVVLNIEIGRCHIKIRDLLNLNKGSIIELDKLAGEPVDVYANGKLISKGNIVTVNGKYCVRLSSINESKKAGS